jgi:hypothetical protein
MAAESSHVAFRQGCVRTGWPNFYQTFCRVGSAQEQGQAKIGHGNSDLQLRGILGFLLSTAW